MRSSNPVLNSFTRYRAESETMTISGTVMKTFILLLLALSTAGFTWGLFFKSGKNPAVVSPWMVLGLIGGLISGLGTVAKPNWAVVTAPLYALFEGLVIGSVSSLFELQFPGVVIQAASLTFGTLFAMLVAYQTGLVRPTEKFRLGIFAATGAIAVVYFGSFLLSIFGIHPSFLYSGGTFGLFFSLIVTGIAALNLILDFDLIERGANYAPKFMEWYGAFALMVTLIWLYMECLRLLAKLRERR